MKLSEIIRTKGSDVVTIKPEATVADLISLLAKHNIGAVVVSADEHRVDGIISERDVVRALAAHGAEVLASPVSAVGTSEVFGAEPEDEVETVARTMTVQRVRHVPILAEDGLAAIISIGDIVKYRIDQLTEERDHLLGYVHQ